MNATENLTSNVSDYYYSLDFILTNFAGSTWVMDNVNFWPYAVFGPVAFVLNAIAFLILQGPEFDTNLYKYMIVYTANNTVFSLCVTFNWINVCFRLIPWSNSYLTQALDIYFQTNVCNVSYFYGSLIDMCVLIDRIAILKSQVRNMIKLTPYKICMIAFVTVVVIDSPSYFVLTVTDEHFKLNSTTSYIVWYFKNSDFANTQLGIALTYMVYGIREGFVTLAQIFLNMASMYCFKQHMHKKTRLSIGAAANRTGPAVVLHMSEGKRNSNRVATSSHHLSGFQSTSISRISLAETRATVMCLVMCVLSLVEHVLVLTSVLYPFLDSNYFNLILIYNLAFQWQVYKRVADFFILFFMNSNFRNACLKFLRIN
jgi:hypothetical protein